MDDAPFVEPRETRVQARRGDNEKECQYLNPQDRGGGAARALEIPILSGPNGQPMYLSEEAVARNPVVARWLLGCYTEDKGVMIQTCNCKK